MRGDGIYLQGGSSRREGHPLLRRRCRLRRRQRAAHIGHGKTSEPSGEVPTVKGTAAVSYTHLTLPTILLV
eukprot:6076382-Pyramimonas_sp.AAC.1